MVVWVVGFLAVAVFTGLVCSTDEFRAFVRKHMRNSPDRRPACSSCGGEGDTPVENAASVVGYGLFPGPNVYVRAPFGTPRGVDISAGYCKACGKNMASEYMAEPEVSNAVAERERLKKAKAKANAINEALGDDGTL